MQRSVLLLVLLVAAACPSIPRTPEQEAKLVQFTSLSSYNEAVKSVTLWARIGKLSATDAESFEELRSAASKALEGMDEAIAAGNYNHVDVLKSAIEKMFLWYITRKEKLS